MVVDFDAAGFDEFEPGLGPVEGRGGLLAGEPGYAADCSDGEAEVAAGGAADGGEGAAEGAADVGGIAVAATGVGEGGFVGADAGRLVGS